MHYSLAGSTDRGCVREHNEDAIDWLNRDGWSLAVVADGMGGYSGGEVASSLAVDLFVDHFAARMSSLDPQRLAAVQAQKLLQHAGELVSERIKAEQRAQPELAKMGTTLLAGFVWRHYISVIHAGDSRCYRWRQQKLTRLTLDHTYVEEMIARGELEATATRNHPMRHVLTRAVGGSKDFEFAVVTHDVEVGDRYLFCSDGLSNAMTSRLLKGSLSCSESPAIITSSLLRTAKSRGADDNVSAVVLCIS